MTRSTAWLLAGIVALGLLLRLYRIGELGLWLDEAFSIWMGWHSLPALFSWLVRIDQHPPLYYTLLHYWLWLGDSVTTVRTLSALIGTLTLPVIFALGRRLAGNKAGLIAALLLAISPFHVRFAQEARMYTLLTLTVGLALLALVNILCDPRTDHMTKGRQSLDLPHRPGRWSAQGTAPGLTWVAYVFFTACALLSHNTAIFFLIATNVFVLGFSGWRHFRPSRLSTTASSNGHRAPDTCVRFVPPRLSTWLLAQAGVLLVWGLWLPGLVVQSRRVLAEFWIQSPTWQTFVNTVGRLLSPALSDPVGWTFLFWALFGLLIVLGEVYLRRRPAILALLLLLVITPFAGELLVSLRRPIFYDRTLIWTTIPLYVLLAFGFCQLRFRPLWLGTLLVVVTVQGFSLHDYYANFQKEQWREAAAYVARNARGDDLILFHASWVQIPFDYYFRTADLPITEHGMPDDLFDRGVLEPKMTVPDLARLRSLLQGRERVWLVYSHDWYTDPEQLIPAALDKTLRLVERLSYYGLELRLYEAPK